jgi:hypothetical protein
MQSGSIPSLPLMTPPNGGGWTTQCSIERNLIRKLPNTFLREVIFLTYFSLAIRKGRGNKKSVFFIFSLDFS